MSQEFENDGKRIKTEWYIPWTTGLKLSYEKNAARSAGISAKEREIPVYRDSPLVTC